MARVMMTKVVSPMLSVPSFAKAASALGSSSSVIFAPTSSFSGRACGIRQSSAVRFWQGVQTRAQSTAQQEKVAMGEDIIDKIKHDHKELDEYFQNYKNAYKQGDEMEARKWFNQFLWEISRHSVSEELVLYPLLASLGEKGEKLADQSREDHHRLKEILAELEKTSDMDKFDEKMDTMMAELKDHIKMEESEDLPYLQQNTEPGARETAGKTFALGKNIAPTRPHPSVPEKYVAIEAALGLLLTPVDKLRDMFTPFPTTDPKDERKTNVN